MRTQFGKFVIFLGTILCYFSIGNECKKSKDKDYDSNKPIIIPMGSMPINSMYNQAGFMAPNPMMFNPMMAGSMG